MKSTTKPPARKPGRPSNPPKTPKAKPSEPFPPTGDKPFKVRNANCATCADRGVKAPLYYSKATWLFCPVCRARTALANLPAATADRSPTETRKAARRAGKELERIGA